VQARGRLARTRGRARRGSGQPVREGVGCCPPPPAPISGADSRPRPVRETAETAETAALPAPPPQGYVPIQWAALNNRVAEATYLLSNGAAINAADPTGQTALHWAAVRGSLPVLETLLRSGADAGLADARGYTVCHVAAQVGRGRGGGRCLEGAAWSARPVRAPSARAAFARGRVRPRQPRCAAAGLAATCRRDRRVTAPCRRRRRPLPQMSSTGRRRSSFTWP
jgi:hypothetical protein